MHYEWGHLQSQENLMYVMDTTLLSQALGKSML